MHYVLQADMFHEKGFHDLVEALERRGLSYDIVKVVPLWYMAIPFGATAPLEPMITPPPGKVCVFGSTSLVKAAIHLGWKPGAWFNEVNFDFRTWGRHYGSYTFNADAQVIPFGAIQLDRPMFIRPTADLKQFAGEVITPDSLDEWKEKITSVCVTLTYHTPVVVAEVKPIYREYRFFIVDERVVAGALYKLGGRVMSSWGEGPPIDREVQLLASALTCPMRGFNREHPSWQPAYCYVIDLWLGEDGYKVGEINCFNSAGWYTANVQDIVDALEGSQDRL